MTTTSISTDPWTAIQRWLAAGLDTPAPPPEAFADTDHHAWPMRRLRDALVQARDSDDCGPMDVAVLTRHALASTRLGKAPPTTWVPLDERLPTVEQWANADLLAAPEQGGLRIVHQPWTPAWLAGTGKQHQPGDAAARALTRRPPAEPAAADPFFAATLHLPRYACAGQREAVRAVALATDGPTVFANLPTGSGKSAVAYAVAGLRPQARSVAIVVVPTTALALDQERAFRAFAAKSTVLPHPPVLAYHGGLPDQAKQALRQRIRTGEQGIVFTSPESLLGSLRAAVFDAARDGLVSLFAVDEAHVAVAWGEEFRPEFQVLAALRDELLAQQAAHPPFPTLLMSGTFTAQAIGRLAADYGASTRIEVVSAAALRPEPEYWIAPVAPTTERDRRVIDALLHLPRPAILYCTRPDDADTWCATLRLAGFSRLTVVHGGTSDDARRDALAGMRGEVAVEGEHTTRTTVDLVVATSAYGLGIDQHDVRAVVHACVPESLDRYYQEVGRGGRDGRASTSVLIPAISDFELARNIARDVVIGSNKARERWSALQASSVAIPGGGRRMQLGQVPRYLFRENDTNAAWNLRTLLLLQQAGALRIQIESPPQRQPNESSDTWDARIEHEWERLRTTRLVEVLVAEIDWQHVDRIRAPVSRRGIEGYNRIVDAIGGVSDLAAAFAREYTVNLGDVMAVPELEIHVARACGGCPACRAQQRRPAPGFIPTPPPPTIVATADACLNALFDRVAEGIVLVAVDAWQTSSTERQIKRALTRLLGHGMRSVVAPGTTNAAIKGSLVGAPVAVETSWQPTALPDIPTAVVVMPDDPHIRLQDVLTYGPPRLAFVDSDQRDPEWPRQTIAERPNVITLAELLECI